MKQKGFTLIELLVVISIIGVLSSIVLASLNSARGKARDATRKMTLRQLQSALSVYYSYNDAYPSTNYYTAPYPDNVYASEVGDVRPNGNNNDGDWIPGLAPTYINKLPKDPEGGVSNNATCISIPNVLRAYMYMSDGVNYKIVSRCARPTTDYSTSDPLSDPLRPDYAWMVCSGEPACSSW